MHAKYMSTQMNVTENNVNLRWVVRKWHFSRSSDLNQFLRYLRNLQSTARDKIATVVVCWMGVTLHGAFSPSCPIPNTFSPFPSHCHFRKEGCEGVDIKWLFYTYGAPRESSLLRMNQGFPDFTMTVFCFYSVSSLCLLWFKCKGSTPSNITLNPTFLP